MTAIHRFEEYDLLNSDGKMLILVDGRDLTVKEDTFFLKGPDGF